MTYEEWNGIKEKYWRLFTSNSWCRYSICWTGTCEGEHKVT